MSCQGLRRRGSCWLPSSSCSSPASSCGTRRPPSPPPPWLLRCCPSLPWRPWGRRPWLLGRRWGMCRLLPTLTAPLAAAGTGTCTIWVCCPRCSISASSYKGCLPPSGGMISSLLQRSFSPLLLQQLVRVQGRVRDWQDVPRQLLLQQRQCPLHVVEPEHLVHDAVQAKVRFCLVVPGLRHVFLERQELDLAGWCCCDKISYGLRGWCCNAPSQWLGVNKVS